MKLSEKEKVLLCKYCGKPIGDGFNKDRYSSLDGLISHPECYNANKNKKDNKQEE